ncbi:MAG: GerW family sporulation protein [Christensenellaceae bacterium]|nr:GerW family sporulation protein [Christensenellaceae bacterium]
MHPIENIMHTSMEQIKGMVDVNTVIGDPVVTANQTMILPVSKVSLGFLVGGGEYGNMSTAKKAADEANGSNYPFAGASAVGMSISPLAFLTVEEGNVRVLPANQKCVTDRLVDMIPHALKGIEKLVNAGIDCLCRKCECSENSSNSSSGNGGMAGCCCGDEQDDSNEAQDGGMEA